MTMSVMCKEHFFKDGDTPIIRSAKLRGQERWEEKLEEDANVIKRQEVQWEKEGDEKWIFAQRPSDATREKWGLETASEESSSEESSSGDSDDERASIALPKMSVQELHLELELHGLQTNGLKAELLDRLQGHHRGLELE